MWRATVGEERIRPCRARLLAAGLILTLAAACDDGRSASVGNDAAGTDGGMDVSGAEVTDTDAAGDNDVATPTPCSPGLPPLGSVCSGYCSNLATACTGANSQFASAAACLDACTAPTWSCGTPTDTTGNTVFCRITHAMAATTAPDAECPQAGPDSASCI